MTGFFDGPCDGYVRNIGRGAFTPGQAQAIQGLARRLNHGSTPETIGKSQQGRRFEDAVDRGDQAGFLHDGVTHGVARWKA